MSPPFIHPCTDTISFSTSALFHSTADGQELKQIARSVYILPVHGHGHRIAHEDSPESSSEALLCPLEIHPIVVFSALNLLRCERKRAREVPGGDCTQSKGNAEANRKTRRIREESQVPL